MTENGFDDRLAACINGVALGGRELANHALFFGGIVEDTPTRGDRWGVASAVTSSGDTELGAVGSGVVGGGVEVAR
ncbi:hypothetical protein [Mycobacterium simiae]|uniref:hypothetical protein n=1 Tax=Mycobacterium simiae TaxID=1784 RepID=UPI00358E0B7F